MLGASQVPVPPSPFLVIYGGGLIWNRVRRLGLTPPADDSMNNIVSYGIVTKSLINAFDYAVGRGVIHLLIRLVQC